MERFQMRTARSVVISSNDSIPTHKMDAMDTKSNEPSLATVSVRLRISFHIHSLSHSIIFQMPLFGRIDVLLASSIHFFSPTFLCIVHSLRQW